MKQKILMNKLKKPFTKDKANKYWHNMAKWRKYNSETEMWKDLYQIPHSIEDVAQKVNTSYSTVRTRMLLCGIHPRKRGTYRTSVLDELENDGIHIYKICLKEGSMKKASKKIGVHYNTLKVWLRRHDYPKFSKPGKPPLDEAIVEEIRKLRSQGFSAKAISWRLDVNCHSIWKYCKKEKTK